LSSERRDALLDWARNAEALVLEDDCDGELRYDNVHSPSLMSLDRAESVCLLGGFAASLGPWVTLAYLAVPQRLVLRANAARGLIDDSRRWLEETALAELLSSAGYARHVHRLNKGYASRRDALLAALRRHFAILPRVWGEHAGLHLAWFPPKELGTEEEVAAEARRCGLDAAVALTGAIDSPDQAVLLGFGTLAERQLEGRIAHLAETLHLAVRPMTMSSV
jgi:GntR family transcriptional regulator/MocR family aminotransferase